MSSEARYQAAGALFQSGLAVQAEAAFAAIVAADPGHAESWHMLGVIASQAERHAEALPHFDRAIRLRPGNADFIWNQATALFGSERQAAGIEGFRRAIRLRPDHADWHGKLGAILRDADRLEDAATSYRRAIRLDPSRWDLHDELSDVLSRTGRHAEALASALEHVRLSPDRPEAHFHVASLMLLQGRMPEGWGPYEWRLRLAAAREGGKPTGAPDWTGQALEGRTVLLYVEQGAGDIIQFCRYATLLARATRARVVLLVRPPLLRLLRSLPEISVVTTDDPFPTPDYQRELLSMPLMFATTLRTIPAQVPYLRAPETDTAKWRERLAGLDVLKVGLAWAGGGGFAYDGKRSIPARTLLPLADVPGVRLVSLQLGEGQAQASVFAPGTLTDWTAELADYADTAALIEGLDLVISVDTSVAHLAGALARPVWLLNRFDPDWRWLLGRDDSPWYPTMRQFRQMRRDDWGGVVSRVVRALADRRLS